MCSRISKISSSVVCHLHAARITRSGGFGERDADRRRSCLFVRVRGFFELPNGRDIYRAYHAVSFLARNNAFSGYIVTSWSYYQKPGFIFIK